MKSFKVLRKHDRKTQKKKTFIDGKNVKEGNTFLLLTTEVQF